MLRGPRAGTPLMFSVPGNPPIAHPGSRSLHTLVLTPEEVVHVTHLLESVSVTSEWWGELESSEVSQERERLTPERALSVPCVACPACAWFDPSLPDDAGDGCGLHEASGVLVEALVERYPQHVADGEACPLKRFARRAELR